MAGQEHLFESVNNSNYDQTTDPFAVIMEAPANFTFNGAPTSAPSKDDVDGLGIKPGGRPSVTPTTPSPEQIELNKFLSQQKLTGPSKDALDYAVPIDDFDVSYTPQWAGGDEDEDVQINPRQTPNFDYDYDPLSGEDAAFEDPDYLIGNEERNEYNENPTVSPKTVTAMDYSEQAKVWATELNTRKLSPERISQISHEGSQYGSWRKGVQDSITALQSTAQAVQDLEKFEPTSKLLPVLLQAQMSLQSALGKMLTGRY